MTPSKQAEREHFALKAILALPFLPVAGLSLMVIPPRVFTTDSFVILGLCVVLLIPSILLIRSRRNWFARMSIALVFGAFGTALLFQLTNPHPTRLIPLSNLKRLQRAFEMYAVDSDNQLPPLGAWEPLVFPYHKEESLTKPSEFGVPTVNAFAAHLPSYESGPLVLLYYSNQTGPSAVGSGLDVVWFEGSTVVSTLEAVKKVRSSEALAALPWYPQDKRIWNLAIDRSAGGKSK